MRARDYRITQLEKHIATIRPAVEQLQTSGRTNSVKRIVAKMIHKKKCLSFFWWLNKLHTVQREERIVCKFVTRMKQRIEWQAFHAMVQHARVRVRHRAVVLHGRRSFFFFFSPPLLLRFLLCRFFSSSVRAHAWLSLPSVLFLLLSALGRIRHRAMSSSFRSWQATAFLRSSQKRILRRLVIHKQKKEQFKQYQRGYQQWHKFTRWRERMETMELEQETAMRMLIRYVFFGVGILFMLCCCCFFFAVEKEVERMNSLFSLLNLSVASGVPSLDSLHDFSGSISGSISESISSPLFHCAITSLFLFLFLF